MKAIVQHQYGAPQDVLHLAEVEMPAVGAEDEQARLAREDR